MNCDFIIDYLAVLTIWNLISCLLFWLSDWRILQRVSCHPERSRTQGHKTIWMWPGVSDMFGHWTQFVHLHSWQLHHYWLVFLAQDTIHNQLPMWRLPRSEFIDSGTAGVPPSDPNALAQRKNRRRRKVLGAESGSFGFGWLLQPA